MWVPVDGVRRAGFGNCYGDIVSRHGGLDGSSAWGYIVSVTDDVPVDGAPPFALRAWDNSFFEEDGSVVAPFIHVLGNAVI